MMEDTMEDTMAVNRIEAGPALSSVPPRNEGYYWARGWVDGDLVTGLLKVYHGEGQDDYHYHYIGDSDSYSIDPCEDESIVFSRVYYPMNSEWRNNIPEEPGGYYWLLFTDPVHGVTVEPIQLIENDGKSLWCWVFGTGTEQHMPACVQDDRSYCRIHEPG